MDFNLLTLQDLKDNSISFNGRRVLYTRGLRGLGSELLSFISRNREDESETFGILTQASPKVW